MPDSRAADTPSAALAQAFRDADRQIPNKNSFLTPDLCRQLLDRYAEDSVQLTRITPDAAKPLQAKIPYATRK